VCTFINYSYLLIYLTNERGRKQTPGTNQNSRFGPVTDIKTEQILSVIGNSNK